MDDNNTNTPTQDPIETTSATPEVEAAQDTQDTTPTIESILPAEEEEQVVEQVLEPSTEEAPGVDEEAQAKAEEEAYNELLKGAPDAPELTLGKNLYGEEVKFGNADMQAIYPALKKAGVPSGNAKAVVSAIAAIQGAKLKMENEQFIQGINAKADECKQVFGSDLSRIKKYAAQGLNLMDKTLRRELHATPVLMNDHRFLSFLAEVGEKFSVDDGGSASAQASESNGLYNPAAWVKTSNR